MPGSEPVVAGPGFRLPFYVVSPWTRGGNLYTAHADHTSQIKFMVPELISFGFLILNRFIQEKWLAAKGIKATTPQINSWRRENMDDLVGMFDFAHVNFFLLALCATTKVHHSRTIVTPIFRYHLSHQRIRKDNLLVG